MPVKKDDKYQVDENKRWFKKWWPEGVPHQIQLEEKTINELLDEQVEKYGDDKFIWFLESWVTYKQFRDYVLSFSTGLYELGVKKGDVVALLMGNTITYVVGYFAITRLGAIATGINPTYQPIEILHQLEITKPKVIIALDATLDEQAAQHFRLPYIGNILSKSSIEKVIFTNLADLARGLGFKRIAGKLIKKIPKGKVKYPGAIKFMNLIKTTPKEIKVDIDVKTHPATYIMSGVTTGLPKAAVLTHFNVVSNAKQGVLWWGGEKPGVGSVGILPLFHSFAHTVIMLGTLTGGGWMMLFPRPPSQEELCKYIEELPCKEGLVYAGAEILFQKLAEFKDIKQYPGVMGKLILCISSAGPLHRSVRKAFIKNTGGNIVEGYGLTEASPIVSAGNFFGKSPVECIGLPIPGTEWGIWPIEDFFKGPICLGGPEDTNFGEKHTGEICIHGPQVMLEYLGQPEETAEIIKEYDGKLWLLTGDIGFMNKDGTIQIRDRKKQLIKYKGYSVFPIEVENLLIKHPEISEVAIAGLPHKLYGETVKAWVVLTPGSTLTSEEIKKWAEENITHFKKPELIDIIKKIPKNLDGTVKRRFLQINDPIFIEKYGKPE